MKKNDKVIGRCVSYTYDGHGVVKIDGFPLFVKGLMLDEVAELTITMLKKTYGFAKYLHIEEESKDRVKPICPIANQCGGCQLQHMSFAHQGSFKKQQVEETMRRIAHVDTPVEDILSMEDPYHYRNKAQVPIGFRDNQVRMGFYRINSNDIIDMKHCYIQSQRINEVLNMMRSLFQKYENSTNFRHLLIKHGMCSDEVMVVFIVRSQKVKNLNLMVEELVSSMPQIKSVILNINQRQDNVILGEEEVLLYGNSYIHDTIHDVQFHISSKSFFQVNPVQTEVLYGKALEYAQVTGDEVVVDLYCGVGTISMFLAKRAKHVIGIEIVPQAIENAKANAKLNNMNNIEFICSDASSYAKKLADEHKSVDVVVVDPPRKGCDQLTLESIVKMNPKRIVYVSCKVSTLARDIQILETMGYQTKKIQPVDMFAHTYGIETVVQLVRH